MEPKRTKYDTNPLEEDFVNRATDSFAAKQSAQTNEVHSGATHAISASADDSVRAYSESEAPTRHIGDSVTSYPSIFVPPAPRPTITYEPPRSPLPGIYQAPPVPPPGVYQPPPLLSIAQKPGTHKIAGLGIPERWAVMLPYLPFWIGIVAAVIELLLVPRTESRTRFHAAQGLILQIAVTAITMVLSLAGDISGRVTGGGLFKVASFVFFIIAMCRVWQGKSLVIPPLDEPRKWLDEKIRPRK